MKQFFELVLQVKIARRARPFERKCEGMSDRGHMSDLLLRRWGVAPHHEHTNAGLHVGKGHEDGRSRSKLGCPTIELRTIRHDVRCSVLKHRLGNPVQGPWVLWKLFQPGGGSGLEGVARAVELKENRVSAANSQNGLVMERRKQVAQPVCGRQCLEQAGLA